MKSATNGLSSEIALSSSWQTRVLHLSNQPEHREVRRAYQEGDLVSTIYQLSFHRRLEQQWTKCVRRLRQFHGQFVAATEQALLRVQQ